MNSMGADLEGFGEVRNNGHFGKRSFDQPPYNKPNCKFVLHVLFHLIIHYPHPKPYMYLPKYMYVHIHTHLMLPLKTG